MQDGDAPSQLKADPPAGQTADEKKSERADS
jgi:hypothetical protein